ncbi:MAG: nucleoside hydrolase [Proteobacteria bacterium]|nr:nucleoside hydrolase [Pseudomonadota bacterium]
MQPPTSHPDDWYRSRLAPPTGRVRVVIDTDTANEIDDQFALAWALRCPQQLDVVAVYAEPFSFAHRRASYPAGAHDAPPFNPPGEGMARSYQEIIKVHGLLGLPHAGRAFRGAAAYMAQPRTPVRSEAVDHLIATAREHTPGGPPLYVLALGCVTNIASALLLAPDIAERIVVVWTSGYPSHAPHVNHSFNLEQDLWASQWLLDSGVPHVYLPGYHVGAQLRLSLAEVERYVQDSGAIGGYLHQLFTHNPLWAILGNNPTLAGEPHSWVIWDLICIAWVLNPAWVPSELVRTPVLMADKRWQAQPGRHWMREAHAVERDAIFNAFFSALRR